MELFDFFLLLLDFFVALDLPLLMLAGLHFGLLDLLPDVLVVAFVLLQLLLHRVKLVFRYPLVLGLRQLKVFVLLRLVLPPLGLQGHQVGLLLLELLLSNFALLVDVLDLGLELFDLGEVFGDLLAELAVLDVFLDA